MFFVIILEHGYDLHRPLEMPPHDIGHPPGPQAPWADIIHPDSMDSLVTYMRVIKVCSMIQAVLNKVT